MCLCVCVPVCVFRQHYWYCCYWSPSCWPVQSPAAAQCENEAGRSPARPRGSHCLSPRSSSPPVTDQSINQSLNQSINRSISSQLDLRIYLFYQMLTYWSCVYLVGDQREAKHSQTAVSRHDDLGSCTHTCEHTTPVKTAHIHRYCTWLQLWGTSTLIKYFLFLPCYFFTLFSNTVFFLTWQLCY